MCLEVRPETLSRNDYCENNLFDVRIPDLCVVKHFACVINRLLRLVGVNSNEY